MEEELVYIGQQDNRILTRGLVKKIAQPQYNPRAEELLDQSGPQRKRIGKVQKKLDKVRSESRPRKRQRPMPEADEDPIIIAYSEEDEEVDPIIIVAGLEGDEQKDQEEEHTKEEEPPQSPPEKGERGTHPICIPPNHLHTCRQAMVDGKLKVSLI